MAKSRPAESAGIRTGAKFAYSAIALALMLGAAEISLRTLSLDLYTENDFFQLNRDINFTGVYDKDRRLFWKLKKSADINSKRFSSISYQTNERGFRGPHIPGKSDIFRIAALGNSCTFGWAVPYREIFTTQLEVLLNNIQVINCGSPGYSSHQGKILTADLLETLMPDMLLIMFGWNDHWPASQNLQDKHQEMPAQWLLDIQNTLSGLEIYKAVRKLSLTIFRPDSPPASFSQISGPRRVGIIDFESNLAEIIKQARAAQAVPVLLSPPIASLANYFPGVTKAPFHRLHAEYQLAIRRVAERAGVLFVDLQPPFDRRNDLYDNPRDDPVHFNAAGHLLAAREIVRVVGNSLGAP
ncbi:MAG: SGNH/GDSL hydrolase family protein [candidate division Zixibacteria bacterium]|nr:SGNH/GDSL hydrolase family protein [candidate division Zixibacteria bacterium]